MSARDYDVVNSQLNFLLSVIDRVGTVADVAANSKSVVTTDGT